MATLALVRHGESELNAQNRECGWIDSPLTEKGKLQAKELGQKLLGTKWNYIFESDLIRSKQTTDEILKVLNDPEIRRISSPAIKERNYGIYANVEKSRVSNDIRRGWDVPIPGGETLKDVYGRVIPYYRSEILPRLEEGKNVIISAHGNSLRALYKYLNNLSAEEIENFEIMTGQVLLIDYTSPLAPPDPSRQT